MGQVFVWEFSISMYCNTFGKIPVLYPLNAHSISPSPCDHQKCLLVLSTIPWEEHLLKKKKERNLCEAYCFYFCVKFEFSQWLCLGDHLYFIFILLSPWGNSGEPVISSPDFMRLSLSVERIHRNQIIMKTVMMKNTVSY